MTQNVQFEETKIAQKSLNTKNAGMVDFLISHKLAKNPQQASFLLVVVALILLSISLFMITHGKKEVPVQQQPDPESVLQ